MNKTVGKRALMLACAAFVWAGCFSASTPKDPATLASQASINDGLLVLDAAGPQDLGTSPAPIDAGIAPEDITVEDSASVDTSSPPDITIPDFASPEDAGAPVDTAPTEDTTIPDAALPDTVEEDITPADAAEEDTTLVDTAPDTSVEPDTGTGDTGVIDAPTPCEGINCPGAQAPIWALEDFQPESPWFKESYGLEKFQGKVTVMALLAGW